MRKYWITAKIFWQNSLAYRANYLMWYLRSFILTLTSLSIWRAIYQNQVRVFNYSQSTMMSYIFLTSILHSLIFSTSLHPLANKIYSGQISFDLLKPINFLGTLISQEIADKIKGFVFTILEIGILYLIFKPALVFPSAQIGLVFIIWTALSLVLYFLINLLFGTIGFWSPDSWGPKFLFFMLLEFTAGKFYPLDVLPAIIQKIIYLTPFPYLSYVQTQLFLGRLKLDQVLVTTLTIMGWVICLSLLYRFIWKKGLKNYTALGQ